MKYPDPSDYFIAVQARSSFKIDKLKRAEFVVHPPLNLPMPVSGSSAVVFKAIVEGETQALRFFTREQASSRERYLALSDYFISASVSDCMAMSLWVDNAIVINGQSWPMVQMEWINGRTLDQYVDHLTEEKNLTKIEYLAAAWRRLIGRMQAAQFAHGDLQHGNVLVDEKGRLRLVDFDCVWIKHFSGKSPPGESGHRNYQRLGRPWGQWMDTFPGLVVYISLLAISKNPDLWEAFHDGENLLFRQEDFDPPFQTDRWRRLASMNDGELDLLVEKLKACCAPGWTADRTLEKLLLPWWEVVTRTAKAVPEDGPPTPSKVPIPPLPSPPAVAPPPTVPSPPTVISDRGAAEPIFPPGKRPLGYGDPSASASAMKNPVRTIMILVILIVITVITVWNIGPDLVLNLTDHPDPPPNSPSMTEPASGPPSLSPTIIAPDETLPDEDVRPAGAYTFAGLADYDHDGNVDIMARENATDILWLYPGTDGLSSDPQVQIGHGWGPYTFAGLADYNHDGNVDIVVKKDTTGDLWLYPGAGVHGYPNSPEQIGHGWRPYTFAGLADYNRDGNMDIVARENENGILWLYPGAGTRSVSSDDPRVQICYDHDWRLYTFAGLADYDHDGNIDIVARENENGILWLYPGADGLSSDPRVRIGHGWGPYTFAGLADYDHDGNIDIVARENETGILWLYPGASVRGYSPSLPVRIGTAGR
jgi:eukaryotic-like serine/threonine-protein kinase